MNCCQNPMSQFDPYKNEVACFNCGVVNDEATQLAREFQLSNDQERESTSNHHYPVNHLMIDELGSQFDMVSNSNRGQVMDLGPGSNARDFQGKRCKPLLKEAYVVGQMVGKGSQAIIDEEGKIRAKSDYRDDKTYRRTKQEAFKRATRLGFDNIQRRFFGKELEKVYCEWGIGISPKLMELEAFIRMTKYKGLDLQLTEDTIKEWHAMVEKVRLNLTEFDTEYLAPMVKATR